VFLTNGIMPSEFDPTTDALLRTIQVVMEVPEEVLAADQQFLCDVLNVIGSSHAGRITMEQTIHVMDMAYIGLIYHRHMPFINEETDEKVLLSADDPAAYTKTLSMLSTALVQQQGVSPEQIMDTASDAAAEAIQHLRQPDSLDHEGLRLHTDFIAMCILGLMVHRLIPSTTEVPK
jgi:hypothetical protein